METDVHLVKNSLSENDVSITEKKRVTRRNAGTSPGSRRGNEELTQLVKHIDEPIPIIQIEDSISANEDIDELKSKLYDN